MKTIGQLLLIFSSLILFYQCSPKNSSALIKDYRSVEGIYIGMPLDEAIQKSERKFKVKKTKNVYLENGNHYLYEVFSKRGKKNLFAFNPGYDRNNNNKVFRLLIKSPLYLTEEKIHTGMTLKELRQKARLKSADFNFTDGLFIQSASFDGGYWMDLEGVDSNQLDLENPSIKSLPGHLKIKSIVLF
jgi:hypothetical protein